MIIFLGVAGSGKSVQSRMLAKALSCDYLSLGALLRKTVVEKTKEKMLNGELLPDGRVISIIEDQLENIFKEHKQFILDGFPRSYVQAMWLTKKFVNNKIDSINVIHLSVGADEIKKRLLARHRKDDTIDAIKLRVKEYNNSIVSILGEFRNKGVNVVNIYGESDVDTVHKQIMEEVGV